MISEKFSKTTSLLLIGTIALAMAGTVSAADIVDPSKEYKGDTLGLITFFLFFVGYISMGAAFVFFMSERSNVAPEYRTHLGIDCWYRCIPLLLHARRLHRPRYGLD